jgi:hypothetical protein
MPGIMADRAVMLYATSTMVAINDLHPGDINTFGSLAQAAIIATVSKRSSALDTVFPPPVRGALQQA